MARECYQGPPGRTYKKRRRSELSTTEIEEIVNCYLTKGMYQVEVAKLYSAIALAALRILTEAVQYGHQILVTKVRTTIRTCAEGIQTIILPEAVRNRRFR